MSQLFRLHGIRFCHIGFWFIVTSFIKFQDMRQTKVEVSSVPVNSNSCVVTSNLRLCKTNRCVMTCFVYSVSLSTFVYNTTLPAWLEYGLAADHRLAKQWFKKPSAVYMQFPFSCRRYLNCSWINEIRLSMGDGCFGLRHFELPVVKMEDRVAGKNNSKIVKIMFSFVV